MNKVTTMLPDQFWGLTPFEAGCIVSGGAFREEKAWERAAFVAAHTINISEKSVKDPVTANQLLGRKDRVRVVDPVADQLRKEAALKDRLGIKD